MVFKNRITVNHWVLLTFKNLLQMLAALYFDTQYVSECLCLHMCCCLFFFFIFFIKKVSEQANIQLATLDSVGVKFCVSLFFLFVSASVCISAALSVL